MRKRARGNSEFDRRQGRLADVLTPGAPKTVESAVSQVHRQRASRTWWAKDLLNMAASYITGDYRHVEKSPKIGGRGYPSGRAKHGLTEQKYFLAAMYVVQHEKFTDYQEAFFEAYLNDKPDSMARERLAEFEIMLDTALDKHPFEADRDPDRSEEATDALNGLIPLPECARYLGIGRTTLFRWLDDGLRNELIPGKKSVLAVQRKGGDYFINFMVALAWKTRHYKGSKARSQEKVA